MTERSPLARWSICLLAVLAAAAIRWALGPWLGDRAPYLLFTLAVLVSAQAGGLGPGLAATALSALAGLGLFVGLPPPAWSDWVVLGIFVAVGAALSVLAEKMRRTRAALGAAAEAETRRAERGRVLADAARALGEAKDDVPAVAAAVARQTALLLEGAAEVRVLSEDGSTLETLAACDHERGEVRPEGARPVPVREGVWARLLESGEPMSLSPLPEGDRELARLGSSPVAVPLAWDGSRIGALLFGRDVDRPLGEDDLALLKGLARQGGVSLARARQSKALVEECAQRRQSEEALRESEQRLQEASRLKDEFLATVSHELRTPLSAILGWAHILRSEGETDPPTVQRALEAIVRNAELQSRLVSELMDISRIVAGALRIDLQPLELVPVIRAALDTVRPGADGKGVTLTSSVDAEAGPLVGDPNRLQQVVWNLVSNAIKFTPRGGQVTVRAMREGSEVVLTVEDTGPGIKPEFLPHVFERFRQGESAAARGRGGLGLGLAIVRHLVELHGGTVSAANRAEGTGAVLTVRLPIRALRTGEPAGAGRSAPAREVAGGPLPSLEGIRVLVVDAEPEAREILSVVLERHGARVLGVGNVDEALACLDEQKPHVVLADLDTVEAAGGERVQKLQERAAENGTVAMAAFTAYDHPEDRTRALLLGFQMQLGKPIQPREVVAAVGSLAGRTGPRAAVKEMAEAPPPPVS
jgi:signal transduction histidine kinase/ActR/RegA family two-component response regulator